MLKPRTSQWKSKVLSLLALSALSTQVGAYSLEDAVYQTMQNHPDILSAKAGASAAEQDIWRAQGGLYPSLDVAAGIGRENSNNPATRATGAGTRVFTRREADATLKQLL